MQQILNANQRVRLTQSTLRHANIRDKKGPSLGKVQVKPRHQQSPHAFKFEDRSDEETERQQRSAQGKAWNFAKIFTSSKRTRRLHSSRLQKSGFFQVPQQESWRGASLWLIPGRVCIWSVRKTLTLPNWKPQGPRSVKQTDLLVTVMLLQETPAVLSLGKLCEEHGYTWKSGQKTHLIKNGKRIDCKKSNYVPFVVPGISASSSSTTPSSASSSSSSQESTSANRESVSDNRGVETPVSERSGGTNEELRGDPLHESTETENLNKNEEAEEVHEVGEERREQHHAKEGRWQKTAPPQRIEGGKQHHTKGEGRTTTYPFTLFSIYPFTLLPFYFFHLFAEGAVRRVKEKDICDGGRIPWMLLLSAKHSR